MCKSFEQCALLFLLLVVPVLLVVQSAGEIPQCSFLCVGMHPAQGKLLPIVLSQLLYCLAAAAATKCRIIKDREISCHTTAELQNVTDPAGISVKKWLNVEKLGNFNGGKSLFKCFLRVNYLTFCNSGWYHHLLMVLLQSSCPLSDDAISTTMHCNVRIAMTILGCLGQNA